ncbi:MAG TPA: hypothetical protein VFP80_01775 [Thermoanaerobaculia bacterium]|nr:hypothetical protein [Thermoanaerobaculia bacterium]
MAQRLTPLFLFLLLALALPAGAATTRNNDSCDIAVLPAATLLLPYFEVDLDQPGGETTLFTVTNVTNTDAIARVTLWTDRGYPALTFNVFLTGYDTQSLNLYDVLARGVIAATPPPRGHFSDPNPAIRACDGFGTGPVPAEIRAAFTTGSIPGVCEDVGGVHENATGYATIDVVGNCSASTPRDPAYWISDIRFDNILMGDYQQLGAAGAQGAPLVHIRAVPEGRTQRTFYSRYTARDRRQPLPSQFAVRWDEGTSLRIWREGRTGVSATCADYAADAGLAVADIVTFDEQENAAGLGSGDRVELTASTKTAAGDPLFPQLANGASSGWIYLNLDRSARDEFASQAWVVSSTDAHGESTAVDAVALGNGCTPPAERSAQIAPRNEDDSCDIALLPAATLLLPYFEVDGDDPEGEQTTFTLTNVSPSDQIARVTLWTDYAFPVITFNVYLTGYDVQTIDLFDVIERGLIAPDAGTGTQVTDRGPLSRRNLGLDLDACQELVGQLPEEYIIRMQSAFRNGTVPSLGELAGCNNVGNEHDNAVGYATIDVVRNCSANDPLSEEYWTEDIGWDNVLIGDSTQTYTDSGNRLAQSSPLVHIRAIPDVRFPRTFYARYQSPKAPRHDGRQPLPSVFAARWIQGGEYETFFKIWREGPTGRDTSCPSWDSNFTTFTESVRFDEAENAWGDVPQYGPIPIPEFVTLPATSRIHTADTSILPYHDNGAVAGWFYLNLDDHDEDRPWATQNWVVASMRAAGRLSVDADAAALGNGCSPQAPSTEITIGTEVLGPRP